MNNAALLPVPLPGDPVLDSEGIKLATIRTVLDEVRVTTTQHQAHRCLIEPYRSRTSRKSGWVLGGHVRTGDRNNQVICGAWILVSLDEAGNPVPIARVQLGSLNEIE